MMVEQPYGLWWLVLINSLVFIIFAFSFAGPRSGRDWRSLGAFAAFAVALFSRLGRREESDAIAQFGSQYGEYMKQVPAFVPRLWHRASGGRPSVKSP